MRARIHTRRERERAPESTLGVIVRAAYVVGRSAIDVVAVHLAVVVARTTGALRESAVKNVAYRRLEEDDVIIVCKRAASVQPPTRGIVTMRASTNLADGRVEARVHGREVGRISETGLEQQTRLLVQIAAPLSKRPSEFVSE